MFSEGRFWDWVWSQSNRPALRAGTAPNAALELSSAPSLAIWIGALFAGRWIVYL